MDDNFISEKEKTLWNWVTQIESSFLAALSSKADFIKEELKKNPNDSFGLRSWKVENLLQEFQR